MTQPNETRKSLGRGKTCFVISPIGDNLSPLGSEARQLYEEGAQMWEKVFEPAITAFGMTPVRADKITKSGEITSQIFTLLRDAEVVLADVTLGNANVMYELGMRHTRDGAITIQVGEHGRLPFDITTIRTIMFLRSEAGLIDLRNSLVEYLQETLTSGGDPITATKVWAEVGPSETLVKEAALASSKVTPQESKSVEEDEKGILELMVEGEAALKEIGPSLSEFSSQLTDVNHLTVANTEKLQAATTFAERLTLIKKYDDAISDSVAGMERTSAEVLAKAESVDFMMRHIAREAHEDPTVSQSADFSSFADSVLTLANSATESSGSMAEMLPAVRNMRKMSTVLKNTSKSIEQSTSTIMRASAIVATWGDLFGAALANTQDDDETA